MHGLKYPWLSLKLFRQRGLYAGKALIWWSAWVNKHAWPRRVLGCPSQGLSTHDMTWHLDLASAPWPGYLLCPLSHLLLGIQWVGIEAYRGCLPDWETRGLDIRLNCTKERTISGNSTCRPWESWTFSNWFLSRGYFTFLVTAQWVRIQYLSSRVRSKL